MSDIIKIRAEALLSPTYQTAELHSRRLGKEAMDATGKSWAHDDVMRLIRLARAEWEINEALARLAALNSSY